MKSLRGKPWQIYAGFIAVPLSIILLFTNPKKDITPINDTYQPEIIQSLQINQEEQSTLEEKVNGIAPLFRPEVMEWEENIYEWANQYDLDPNLVATIMQIESCGYQYALSGGGAMGLFQAIPMHFEDGEDPYNPNINANTGLPIIKDNLENYETLTEAFAAYNGGYMAAEWMGGRITKQDYINFINSIPEFQGDGQRKANEVERYVYWATGIYQDAREGKDQSIVLNEWLAAGGLSLCQTN